MDKKLGEDNSAKVREQLVNMFRRDLVGPDPVKDSDLLCERLNKKPSQWYLTGFLMPSHDRPWADEDGLDALAEDRDMESETVSPNSAAPDNELPDPPSARRRYYPASIGLTVMVPADVNEIEAIITWGDYRTEPPVEQFLLEVDDPDKPKDAKRAAPDVEWVRVPREEKLTLKIENGRAKSVLVPQSSAQQYSGGGLALDMQTRNYCYDTPDGEQNVRVVTVFLVNRRNQLRRKYADLSFIFQARIELVCPTGFCPRHDISTYNTDDSDLAINDLHYRDVAEYGVGRSTASSWEEVQEGKVCRVWTDPLPVAEVERVAPTPEEELAGVEFGMEALAVLAHEDGDALADRLLPLTTHYNSWTELEEGKINALAQHRQTTAADLINSQKQAAKRMAVGIEMLRNDNRARLAFRIMNEAISTALRRRWAGAAGDPEQQGQPRWRPFQLAYIILNLASIIDKTHEDRELVDLLFFPTGGGKTEAYLGLAAFTIAHRRLSASGVLGAGVAVIMRYTLRLLTLDQLSRAAGVICALELARTDDSNVDEQGDKILGDWPIEIGLWVGGDASPNHMGGKGDTRDNTAVKRLKQYKSGREKRAPVPLKECPWCGTPFDKESFSCSPNMIAPTNLEISCGNFNCDFSGDRTLPILTVDEPIYNRLPAFLVATVDKFAALPWVGETGAFFSHVDRYEPGKGFYGASRPTEGVRLDNGFSLDPPDLIIQDELHLISGPLGTVAGLYEIAIDVLSSRQKNGQRVRPKIVASTATVRRASDQIQALFDRAETRIFPPPGIDRTDSFFAITVPSSQDPARWYMGLAAQGRGPKLLFLRALTTLVAAAQALYDENGQKTGNNPVDPYMTALCYFNALRELGGARRIVEDEVRDRAGRYGLERRRIDPPEAIFKNRRVGEPLELTSRVSTDEVAKAKQRLEAEFGTSDEIVDVALATNMISVGLDITRLGLMLVQSQPKTAAEYIQATSRVGRDHNRPGLVLTILNLHKPRDRTHYESFGHFHRSFYRAVEATSVTPWAARALDRALAAVVVSIGRHIEPDLSAERTVQKLADHKDIQDKVVKEILSHAPKQGLVGGHEKLEQDIRGLIKAWIDTAEEQVSNGTAFGYSRQGASNHLLQNPLDPALPNLSKDHQRFVAGRSMRDVEPNVDLLIRDPWGNEIKNAKGE